MSETRISADRGLSNARWSVVYTQPHREIRVQAHLQNQGFRAFLPLIQKTVRHARQFHTRRAPLFPRYLFVQITIGRDRWTSIRGTYGVTHLMMDGEQPRAVPDDVIDELLRVTDSDNVIELAPTLKPGQHVRMANGPFAGLVGKLASLDENGRVKVLLDILGTEIAVTSSRVGLVPAA